MRGAGGEPLAAGLVRARKTSSRLGWPSANSPMAMPAWPSAVTAAAAWSLRPGGGAGADPGGQQGRLGSVLDRRAEQPGERRLASGRCAGSDSLIRRVPDPVAASSWPGVSSAITRPWSITAIRAAS